MKSPRDKAADLVRLATAETASEGERANAALAACRLIERYGLLSANGHGSPGWTARRVRVESETVVLASSALCRGCMQRIGVGVPCHRIEGRGYQCPDCGPWTADVADL